MLAIEWRRVSYIYLLHSDLASARRVYAEHVRWPVAHGELTVLVDRTLRQK
jgi:hypothetical protein